MYSRGLELKYIHISEFDYILPEGLIAQFPTEKRDESRLIVLNRDKKTIEHKHFYNIVDYLCDGDVLVLNDTRVIPARLIGKKSTGAVIEVFLIRKLYENKWETLVKPSKRVKPSVKITFSNDLEGVIIDRSANDKWIVEFVYTGNFYEILHKTGHVPLPPYIQRDLTDNKFTEFDLSRYQTVYAQNPGSVAAPTAGLHFTSDLLEKLRTKGVKICYVTLNVGLGTFKPVKCENIEEHLMDREYYEIPKITADIINEAKYKGKNIIAVGTTSIRTLESAYSKHYELKECAGESGLFIYPGYKFNVPNKIITNFHLPKSTLIMLVSAFAGRDFIFKAYREAVEKKYRFYSYGDCMIII